MSSTVQGVLRIGTQTLAKAGIDGPARDARLLMAACLDVAPARMTLHLHDPLEARAEAQFFAHIQDRAARKPISHILGHRAFWGRRFAVTPDVLDPRPETETLIATALEVPFGRVLDLGTGSGCILLTLLAERPVATGVGADMSTAALDVARGNAADIGGAERCVFVASDWFAAIDGPFDLIVSNPPYIATTEMADLSAEVLQEPRMALTDGADGLSCYRVICGGADSYLTKGGWLMLEIGPTQGAAVVAMMEGAGMVNVGIRCDFDGRDRVVVGQKTP